TRQLHVALLEQEAVLRGEGGSRDLAADTLERLRSQLGVRTERRVLDEISRGGAPVEPKPIEPRADWLYGRRFWTSLAAAAAVVLLAVGARSAYLSGRHAQPAEALVYGQWELSPGGQGAYRVLVRDGMRRTPVPGAEVDLSILNGQGREVWSGSGVTGDDGTVEVTFVIPEDLEEGDYTLRVESDSEKGEARVLRGLKLHRDFRVLVTTDKPLYQPGQVIHIRALSLARIDGMPAGGRKAVIEVRDGKGNKVFKKVGKCSDFGIFSGDFQLADQVNTGQYAIVARVGDVESEKSVEVKRYVLPKFKVQLATGKGFYLPGETLSGDLSAVYTFGENVEGARVRVRALEFIERFREFATAEGVTDASGKFSFELPLRKYFAGTQLRRGDATVHLEATVTDKAGHVQKRTASLTVTANPIRVELIPESGTLVQNVENALYIITAYPDGRPAKTTLKIGKTGKEVETSDLGIARVRITPHRSDLRLTVMAEDEAGLKTTVSRRLRIGSPNRTFLLRTDRAVYRAGESAALTVISSRKRDRVFVDAVKEGRTVLMKTIDVQGGTGQLAFDLPEDLFGTVQLHAYRIASDGNVAGDTKIIQVRRADDLRISAAMGKKTYRPAEKAIIEFAVTGRDGGPVQAALGLAGVDEAVFALHEMRPGLERVYFALQEEILKPRWEICAHPPVPATRLLEQEDLPDPDSELEEASVALFSAAEGSGGPQSQIGETFAQKNIRFREEEEEHRRLMLGTAALLPVLGFLLLTLPIIGYALYRLKHLTPIRGAAKRDIAELRHNTRAVALWWALGVYLPIVAAVIGGAIGGDSGALLLGGGAAVGVAAMLALSAVRVFLCPAARAVPIMRKLVGGVPAAYALGATSIVTLAAAEDEGLVSAGTVLSVLLGELGVMTLAAAALSVAGHSVLAAISATKWWGISLSRLALAGGPILAVLLLGSMLTVAGGRMSMMSQLSEMDLKSTASPGGSWGWGDEGSVRPSAMPEPAMPVPERPMDPSDIPTVGDPGTGDDGGKLKAPARVRRYFPETMLWVPELVTDEKGRAFCEIPQLPDSITTWRIGMSAVSARGALGSGSAPLRVFQPFFVDVDFPVALTQGDVVSVPVAVYNYLDKSQTVRLEVQPSEWYRLTGSATRSLTLKSREITSVYLTMEALRPGRHSIVVKAFGSEMADAVERSVRVEPDGLERVQVFNGTLKGKLEQGFRIPAEAIDGANDLVVKIYPGSFSQVMEGLDSIFQMPYGCFEQTSSTTYPNVLVLDYLRRTGQVRPEIEMKALNYINVGYQRLLSFEVSGGGFDWYGKPPATTVLTAYGLMEFADMSRVHEVDPAVISRTRQWLMSQRRGDGSWKSGRGMHSAMHQGADGDLRTTAYIAWALAQTGALESETL
ncbi:MAG: MG2 domain-containing protein, partial [Planctomycetota bacterium]